MKTKINPPHLNLSLLDIEGEEWRDVLGYDGIYNVSNFGRVKSIGRYVNSSKNQIWVKEKILKQFINSLHGDPSVKLSCDGVSKTWRVATLVYNVFMRIKNKGEEVCHLNKNKLDNRIENLVITSHSISQEISYKRGNMTNWGIESNSIKNKEDYLNKFGIYDNGILVGKICSCCNSERMLRDFYKGNICKSCVLVRIGVNDVGKNNYRKELANAGLRYCSICKKLKSLNRDFGKSANSFLGKSNSCKECVKQKNYQYRAKNKTKATKLCN
jgi:hypothetical protein